MAEDHGSPEALPSWSGRRRSVMCRRSRLVASQVVWAPERQKSGKKRKPRKVVQKADQGAEGTAEQAQLDDFEIQRQANIARNKAMMAQLELQSLATDLQHSSLQSSPGLQVAARAAAPRPNKPRPKACAKAEPLRQSARQRGSAPSDITNIVAEAPSGKLEGSNTEYLTQTEYLQQEGLHVQDPIMSDGSYHGWACPHVCRRFGIQEDAESAWEAHGGGKFTFKIDRKALPAHLKARGWSDARAFSHTQLQKNPNMFFYRHVQPGESQAQGEWTQEEHEQFLQTAREHGVGDKWGLFSTYLPQRVGYQCSAYYREVIIPQGLVMDGRFRLTRSGRAVFCA